MKMTTMKSLMVIMAAALGLTMSAGLAQNNHRDLDPEIANELVVLSRSPYWLREQAFKDALNQAWNQLPAKMQKALEPEHRKWVKWKNTLDKETRESETEYRAYYIMAIAKGQNPEKVKRDLEAYRARLGQ